MVDLKQFGKMALVANLQHGIPGTAPDEEAEYDSPETAEAIAAALRKAGADVMILEADRDLPRRLLEEGIGFAFNIAEGKGGRDREAQVPGLLSLLGIPYSGGDALAMGITLDKDLCKTVVSAAGVRTAPSWLISPGQESCLPAGISYPVILKPNAEGSGKGITEACVAENEAQLKEMLTRLFALYPQDMLAEHFLAGREFTVGFLGNGPELQVFPPMEIIYEHPTQGEYYIYSYEIKKDFRRHVHYRCPAELDPEVTEEITEMARRAFEAVGCRDLARADFRMDADGVPYFLEINPLPGLAPGYSDYPMAAEALGYGYEELVAAVAQAAVKRCAAGGRLPFKNDAGKLYSYPVVSET